MTSTEDRVARVERPARRPAGRRRALAAAWACLGVAAAVWLHAPARILDAGEAIGSGTLQIAGLASRPATGARATPVADVLDQPDFTLRLNPQYSHIVSGGAATLRLRTASILGMTGRLTVRATLESRSGGPAGHGVRVDVTGTIPIGAATDVLVTAGPASAGRYILTLDGSSGGVSHVCSAAITISQS